MADFVNKMILIATQFKTEMGNVTAMVKKNKEEVEKQKQALKNFKDNLGRIAGVVGAVVASYEIFTKAMNANADSARDWQATVDGAKLSVNMFFAELSRGKFDNLNEGFLESIANAKEFYRVLSRAKGSLGILKTGNEKMEAERNLYSNIINSPTATDAEIDEAYKKYMAIATEEVEERDKQNSKIKQDIFKRLMPKFSSIKTPEQLIDVYQKYTNFFRDEYDDYEAYKKQMAKYKEESGDSFSWDKFWENLNKNSVETYKDQTEAKKALRNKRNPLYEDIMVLEDLFHSDENLEPLLLEMMDVINTNIDKKGSLDAERKGVIEDYAKRLEERNNRGKKTPKETTTETPQVTAVKEEQKEVGSLASLYAELHRVQDLIKNTDTESPAIKTLIDEEEQLKKNIALKEEYLNTLRGENGDNKTGSTDITVDTDKDIKSWAGDATQGVNSLSSALGTLGGALDDSAGQWLNFVATFASSVAQVLPLVEKLIIANTAEAGSEGAKQVSKIPMGWLLIPAVISSIVAMFSALPKFANGGIFSTVGDMNLARLNDGEMVLNNRQQRNLWNLINNGNTPNTANNAQVEFHISGKELVGCINNYQNKVSKVR